MRNCFNSNFVRIFFPQIDVGAIINLTEKDFDDLGVTIGDRRALQSSFASSSSKKGAIEKLKEFLKAKNQRRKKGETKPVPKKSTLKLEIGWRHKSSGSQEYRQVKFPQGGGTRLRDFDRNATYETVLSAGKDFFFPNGVNKHKSISLEDIDIFLGNYSGNCVESIDGLELSVERYRQNASVSKGNVPRVYVMSSTRKETDKHGIEIETRIEANAKEMLGDLVEQACAEFGDAIMEEMLELPILQHEEEISSTALQDTRDLIKQQDEEYRLSLEEDQQKEEDQEKNKKITREKEALREERKARIPNEPQIDENHIVACVRHPNLGTITRPFSPTCQMDAVYDWTGSLQTDPQHFALFVMTEKQMKTLVYPSENIIPQTMLYMEETEDAIPPAKPSQHLPNNYLHINEVIFFNTFARLACAQFHPKQQQY